MARTNRRHEEIVHGSGKCSVPMWVFPGYPAGFCDHPAFGEQTKEGRRRYDHYVPALACVHHGGPTLEEFLTGKTLVRFDGPPGPKAGRFVEVECDGASINAGQWIQDGEYWLLVMHQGDSND